MLRRLIFRAALACLSIAIILQGDFALGQGGVNQRSNGNCSPNINSSGNVNVICPPVPDPQLLAIQRAERAREFRARNNGCDIGSHRECSYIQGRLVGCVCIGGD
jgi:hypothetical protein